MLCTFERIKRYVLIYKSGGTLEAFRERLEQTTLPNTVKTFQFRLAEKYGMVVQQPKEHIKFYFEKMGEE